MNAKVVMGVRILFGVFCLVFGLNKFLNFLPPFEIPGDGGVLMGIYMKSGFMYIIGALEAICGLLLLLGKYVPLALSILGAIMLNALLFHILHDPANIGGAVGAVIMNVFLAFAYKERFSSIFSA